jgi:hypothetical protein
MNLYINEIIKQLQEIINLNQFIIWTLYSMINLMWIDIKNRNKNNLNQKSKFVQNLSEIQYWVFTITMVINWIILLYIGIKINFYSSLIIWIGTGLISTIIFSVLYRNKKIRNIIEHYFPVLTLLRILVCTWFLTIYFPTIFR